MDFFLWSTISEECYFSYLCKNSLLFEVADQKWEVTQSGVLSSYNSSWFCQPGADENLPSLCVSPKLEGLAMLQSGRSGCTLRSSFDGRLANSSSQLVERSHFPHNDRRDKGPVPLYPAATPNTGASSASLPLWVAGDVCSLGMKQYRRTTKTQQLSLL